jgi:predicted DNA-binding transcriptional regulator YafY
MSRNAVVIRQWKILRELDARHHGLTVPQLVEVTRDDEFDRAVTQRTIFRDMNALTAAGFPLTTEARDGHVYYKLDRAPFSRLTQTGFSFSELCALYLSRRVVESLTGLPFQTSLRDAFAKFETVISDGMRKFIDELPLVVSAKPTSGKVPRNPKVQEFGNLLVQAALDHRVVDMLYHSASHHRKKRYVVHPLRIIYVHGGFYLYAYVPEYDQIRTFATQRIRELTVREETFARSPAISDEPFAASLGAGQGRPVHVVVRFDAEIADYVKERQYHKSQRTSVQPDGSLRVELDVCNDVWLKSWVLGFGHLIQVMAPEELALDIVAELRLAKVQYAAVPAYEDATVSPAFFDFSTQGRLPFSSTP